jgi:Fe-S-cluster-containing dehydrogenase component
VQVCPVGATFVSPDGVVLVDPNYCLGCRYCVQACPYGCRYFHPEKEIVDKCTLCYHRITKGLTTACCESCPTGARQLVDLKNPKDPVHEFLRTNKVQVLKPQMATGSKVYYKNLDGSVR